MMEQSAPNVGQAQSLPDRMQSSSGVSQCPMVAMLGALNMVQSVAGLEAKIEDFADMMQEIVPDLMQRVLESSAEAPDDVMPSPRPGGVKRSASPSPIEGESNTQAAGCQFRIISFRW